MCLFSMFNAFLNAVCSYRLHPYTGEEKGGKGEKQGKERKREGARGEGKICPLNK